MGSIPSPQEVADALGLTLERQHSSGTPWCPPGDGTVLRHWVIDRTGALGSGIRRAVRLARLMAVADGRDYSHFLYLRLSCLRASQFRALLAAAVKERRLPTSVATLSEAGVNLKEAALGVAAQPQEGFEINYAQMPRLAALLDFMHNALGFSEVADLLAPVCRLGTPPSSANEVGRALHAALNAWLGDRLESTNHIRQAQLIRAFLTRRGQVVAAAIDDEAILAFWEEVGVNATEDGIEGFRLYRSSAAALLRYRQSLLDASFAREIERSFSRGFDGTELQGEAGGAALGDQEAWHSPLYALARPPAHRVKWLTRREQHSLINYLGDQAHDPDEEPDEESAQPWIGGLADRERFDLGFSLTLLRCDVFGAAQASIVARLRKRARPEDAIAHVMAEIAEQAYPVAISIYSDIREQLHLECQAALCILMEAGATEAVLLLDFLVGPDAVRAMLGDVSLQEDDAEQSVLAQIGEVLRRVASGPHAVTPESVLQLLQQARSNNRKVNRAGFRREDRASVDALGAMQVGAPAAIELIRELDRLILSLAAQRHDGHADRARFHSAFRQAYFGAAAQ
jgi:hypothetical protein